MIKCNRCGNMTPPGATCQSCGAPLPGKAENGFSSHAGRQSQPEVPAWLESLRAGERPAAPADTSASFSPADLIDEGNLPSWMKAERGGRETTGANPALQNPAAYPSQSDNEDAAGSYRFTANSLIDEKSLPSWMQGQGEAQPSQPPAPGSLSASSLVQPDSLPDWMQHLQQPSAGSAAPSQSSAVPPTPAPVSPSATSVPTPGSAFSAHDLIDEKSLPSWMQGQGPAGQQRASSAASAPRNGQPDAAQQNQPFAPAPSSALPPTPQSGGSRLAASSLLDLDALPQWLREGEKQGNKGNNSGAPRPTAGGNQNSGQGVPSQGNNRVSASSFIDMNALPNWLRDNEGVPLGPATTESNPYGGAGNVPVHADNMHVPSRPRNEMNQSETNEMAANVFASMLGVASSTPKFPGQQSPAANSPQPSVTPGSQSQSQNQPPYQHQPAQSSSYGQPYSPAAYGQTAQPGQSSPVGPGGYGTGNPDPYSQLSQAGLQPPSSQTSVPNPGNSVFGSQTSIPNPGNMYGSQTSIPNPGGVLGSQTSIPNPGGNIPGSQTSTPNPQAASNPPSSFGGGYNQNYAQNGPASYNGFGGANQGQGNAANSAYSSYGSNAGSMPSPSGQKGKKRSIFEAIREWLAH